MISWTGNLNDPKMALETFKSNVPIGALHGHSAITYNEKQTIAYLCDSDDNMSVSAYKIEDGTWVKKRSFEENTDNILMLELSKNENWCSATILNGFILW